MVVNTARQVRDGLAELIRLANDPTTSTSDLRVLLGQCKIFGGQLTVLQADTATGVAARESHCDSGVGVLAQAAGLSRQEAAGQVQTARSLQEMPAVRDAVESGVISVTNAKALARASARTSAEQVDGDAELLEKAAAMSPERFTKEAGRWAIKRQDDGGESEYRRHRAARRLSFWDGDDGMVHLRGELDPVTGAKVRKRFIRESERLRRLDLHGPGSDKRSLNQRMADALDTLTSHGSIYTKIENDTNEADHANREGDASGGTDHSGNHPRISTGNGGADDRGARCGCSRVSADITIVQHLSAEGTDAFAEIDGGAVIPPSVLEEYFCNARITGVVFGSEGMPLWHGHAKRRATKAQMNALRARYGGCGGCGANMWICDGHHIRPVSQGGPTNIDNLMLLCWACHQKVHHHDWRVVPDGQGLHTIEPPERIRHGPAHAPDPPPFHGPHRWGAAAVRGAPPLARPVPDRAGRANSPPSESRAEPLFTIT